MLLAENALPLLLEELARLPARDRRAILARLSPEARERIARLEAVTPVAPAHSPDVAARIAALRQGQEHGLTAATAEALRQLLDIAPVPSGSARGARSGPSLVDSLGNMFRRGRGAG